ncbi:hypothetical protein [Yoonia sp. SS1-5]|uniref:DUF4760 domain-containing protein n=1 Tax=Yoonia rhodophyticola TaxID=3137370 RepID=A0AAN0NM39_9RHOB
MLSIVGGLLLSGLTFVIGKMLSQSEKVIEQKKEVYREFLAICPTANDAATTESAELERKISEIVFPAIGLLSIYASHDVLMRCKTYFDTLDIASKSGQSGDFGSAPKFADAAHAYNLMLYDMRRDVMAWTLFSLKKQPRDGFASPLNPKNRSG